MSPDKRKVSYTFSLLIRTGVVVTRVYLLNDFNILLSISIFIPLFSISVLESNTDSSGTGNLHFTKNHESFLHISLLPFRNPVCDYVLVYYARGVIGQTENNLQTFTNVTELPLSFTY